MGRKSGSGLRGLADEVRVRPLVEVAPLLGYRQDTADRSRWRREGSVISVTGPKFFDHLRGCGGGGAIDLVIHARGCTPVEAIYWLAGAGRASAGPGTASSGRFVAPPSCGRNWRQVRAWLLGVRKLEERRVDALHAGGWVYADMRSNAVFLCRNAQGAVTGAELVGIRRCADGSRFRALARGSRKAAGGFWVASGNAAAPRRAFIAESALDALSALSIGAGVSDLSIHASVAGVCRRLPDWLGGFALTEIVCGFDADEPGDAAAAALAASDGRVSRARPCAGKDWNGLLQAG